MRSNEGCNCGEYPAPEGIKILSQPALKHEVNERLAAYRNRRGAAEQPQQQTEENSQSASTTAEQIKARVRARYAQAASYSDELSASSTPVERVIGAVTKAAVEAVIAEMGQAAVTPSLWDAQPAAPVYAPPVAAAPAYVAPASVTPSRWQDEPQAAAAPMPTRWEDAVPPPSPVVEQDDDIWESMRVAPSPYQNTRRTVAPPRPSNEGELFPYDPMDPATVEDPFGESVVEPAQPIQANIIEFPRPLVAPRKVRGRLAEGPYRRHDEESQLSIFEVEPEAVASSIPEAAAQPQWASIELEAQPEHTPEPEPEYYQPAAKTTPWAAKPVYAEPVVAQSIYEETVYEEPAYAEPAYEESWTGAAVAEPEAPSAAAASWEEYTVRETYAPQLAKARRGEQTEEEMALELLVAPVADRAMAALIDVGVVTLATVVASFAAVACMSTVPSGRLGLIGFGIAFVLLGAAYQALFLSFSEKGTVGMAYARIALCTFDDDNPTRQQMRMRIPATVLSVVPAGLGLVWSLLDKEHVSWHDRLTHTYQRKY